MLLCFFVISCLYLRGNESVVGVHGEVACAIFVHFTDAKDGNEDTFVYTGDIHAMWLRDSAAQVWPYVQLAKGDRKLQKMLRGVIRRQLKCINIDPYANAFNREPVENGPWANDMTDMKPELHERKYEIDSLCYPIRLAYHYWQVTGDASVFGDEWLQAVRNILRVFREQQRKQGLGSYRFQRETEDQLDTVCNHGWGNPVKPCSCRASFCVGRRGEEDSRDKETHKGQRLLSVDVRELLSEHARHHRPLHRR